MCSAAVVALSRQGQRRVHSNQNFHDASSKTRTKSIGCVGAGLPGESLSAGTLCPSCATAEPGNATALHVVITSNFTRRRRQAPTGWRANPTLAGGSDDEAAETKRVRQERLRRRRPAQGPDIRCEKQ